MPIEQLKFILFNDYNADVHVLMGDKIVFNAQLTTNTA